MHEINLSMLGLIVVVSVGTALWLTCAQWMRKQCPACRYYIPARATRCRWCHTRQMVVASLLLCLCSTGVQAETGCPTLSFFAEPCLEDEQLTEPMPPPPPAVQLFPKDAVAKDTPPALLQMLQQPEARTLAQARQFVRQQQEKQRVLMQVQQLIQQATREQAGPVQQ